MNWENIFYYDETSPTFLKWKYTRRNFKFNNIIVLKDEVAGCLRFYKNGLPKNSAVSLNNCSYYIHRIIYEMAFMVNLKQYEIVDHLDGNPHNNKLENLRLVSLKDNAHNVKKMSHNTTGITGVVYSKSINSWRAVWYNGNGKQLSKSFSVNKYGFDKAKQLAIELRALSISKLIQNGNLYTERHGK
jgi:hypothetical protein